MTLPFPIQCRAAGLPEPVSEFRFHETRRWRFDFAFVDQKVAMEVDGGGYVNGRHSRGAGIEKDCEKFNQAIVLGWKVLRVTPKMIRDGRAIDVVQAVLR